MKHLLRHIIPLLTALTALAGCQDDEYALPEPVGEGMATITASVDFMPMPAALSRSGGAALGDSIRYLYILLYDAATEHLQKSIPIKVSPDDAGNDFYTISGYKETSQERSDADAEGDERAESQTRHAEFKLWDKIAYGSYYMYAVANIKNLIYDERYVEGIQTREGLKNIILGWDETDVTQNGEMLGHFTATATATASEAALLDELIEINRQTVDLHCWLRRAASKVTVAFNGSGLNPGVSIYVLASSIKDIPRTCLLGNTNTPAAPDDLIADGETIQYYTGSSFSDITLADFKAKCPCVSNDKSTSFTGSDHSETANALYFYENMQGKGEDKRQKDANGDGIVDNRDRQKDAKPYGTYIEVDAIYTATNESGTETGVIKYRFMLGKDVETDYDAERNYHYKLTLCFNGTAKDPDWHIDYQKQVFKVTQPKEMDYRGMVFVPEYRPWTKNFNLGHKFDYNTVTVSSYIEENNQLVPWKMEYSTDGGKTYTNERPGWLSCDTLDGYLPYVKTVRFRVTSLNVEKHVIDDRLKSAPSKSADPTLPYNLANPGEIVAPKNATIRNTANCYMVDAPGYYMLPLVYGNAIKNTITNEDAYYNSSAGANELATFRDHLGNPIAGPFIRKAASDPNHDAYEPLRAFVVWQDADNVVKYNIWAHTWATPTYDVQYLPEAYSGVGGIVFYVDPANIKQGNAVVGISTQEITSANLPDNIPDILWSWHIWVTDLSFLDEDDTTIEVTGHGDDGKFRLMPVNLGWCSAPTDTVKYYKARECKVRFYVPDTDKSEVITLKQKSHIATTRGNSPYFQWGRKDPFVGAIDDGNNIKRYLSLEWSDVRDPTLLFDVNSPNDARWTSRQAIATGLLIRKPQCWHNPLRTENDSTLTGDNYKFRSLNETYTNLWQQPNGEKTVYDPCPVGYQVPGYKTFSGFTTTGKDTNTEWEWYEAIYDNIADYDADASIGGDYTKGLYEFYTDSTKLQSIVVPEAGYRDWDNYGRALEVNSAITTSKWGPIGYLWTASYRTNPKGNHKDVLNLEFARKDRFGKSYIRPQNPFYSCDGFPIRPLLRE